MTIESLPLGGVPRSSTENPLSKLARAIRRSITKERTGGRKEKEDPTLLTKAAYMGICLAHEKQSGRMTEEHALRLINDIGESGLPKRQIIRTYTYFVDGGINFDWFDINFQISTLQEYLPELLPQEFKKE